MSEEAHVLAIDLGTSGPKVALVRADGEIVAASSRTISIHLLPEGGAEQDPEEILSSVEEAAAEVVARSGVARDSILGIGTTSQFSSIVPVDASGEAAMNLVLWMDRRGVPHTQKLYERSPDAVPTWIEVHGLMPLPSGADSLSHMLFVQHERPEVYARTHKFVEAMDFLSWHLTGRPTANPCTAFLMLLTDNRNLETPAYHEGLVERSGIDAEKLPELVPVNSCVGTLLPERAAELGLSPDTKVFSGTNDTQAASVAAGTFRSGHGGLNIGSTAQVLADAAGKRTDLANDLLTMPSPIRGRFNVLAENGLAGKALDHFVRDVVFARDAFADCSAGSTDPFANLERTLEATPPGSRNLLFLPWLTGTGSPGADDTVRGAFVNFSLETGRQEMIRAVVEGITFSLRWLLGAVEEFAETRLDPLHFSGGGARSDGWAQIAADVTGRPVRQLEDAHHTGSRAAAFLAFRELGLVGLDEHDKICRTKREYAPREANREVYDRLFEAFLESLKRNKPVFAALNRPG